MLLSRFTQHIAKEGLFLAQHRLLLALSGGLDSVVLMDLLFRANYHLGVAHLNFKLRGAESEADAAFVANLAQQYGLPSYLKEVDTRSEILAGESIQVAARRLRYDWLEQVRKEEAYDFILTAHHAHDNLETVLMRFVQGSGLSGMRGIPQVNERVIRPLLTVSRREIEAYARERALPFREDASNKEDYYLRNKIRHHLTPLLEAINPALSQTITENTRLYREAYELYTYAVDHLKAQLWIPAEEGWDINKAALAAAPAARSLLHEWLSPLGFTDEQCRQALEARQGSLLLARAHSLLVGAEYCHIRPLTSDKVLEIQSLEGEIWINEQEKIDCSSFPASTAPAFLKEPAWAYIDRDKLQFPLRLRRWQAGDYFCPLGMGGKKQKLQDFFINQKINRQDRMRQWVLENGDGELVWVLGQRADERYKITESTQHYIVLHYLCFAE